MVRVAIVALGVCLLPIALRAQDAKPLRTGVDGTFAPHAMPKMSGGVEGFNIDLAEEIARRLKAHAVTKLLTAYAVA